MLPRANRLTSGDAFRRTIRSGLRAGAATLVVHYLCAEPPSGGAAGLDVSPRVGFVVSKAVGDSVTRHRVQRRLRHLVRAQLPRLADSSVLVVRALPAASSADSRVLGTDLDDCLGRVLRRSAA
ncbi:MAG: ribonuclease P protein component [Nocardioidaceae bacterium]